MEVVKSEKGQLRDLRFTCVNRGFKWEEIKTLSLEELQLLEKESSGKREYVNNPSAMVERVVNAILEKKRWYKLMSIEGAWDYLKCLSGGHLVPNFPELEEEVLPGVLDLMVKKQKEKEDDRKIRLGNRLSNRATYIPAPILSFGPTEDNTKLHWKFENDLISWGMMQMVLQDTKNIGERPVQIRIENRMPNDETGQQIPIPTEEWELLRKAGYLPTNGNLAWDWQNPKVREILVNCFPKVIDMGAYNHRLSAPLLPSGFFRNVTVNFANPMGWSYEAESGEETTQQMLDAMNDKKTAFERDMECDGSGLYNPKHPMFHEFVAKYGVVVFQFTMLRPDGLFAKGILVPREDLPENVSVQLDMAQVKGQFKGKIIEGQVENGCYIGVMKTWNRKGMFPGSFEMLEMIKMTKNNRERIIEIITDLITENVGRTTKRGINGLLEEAAKDDEHINLMVNAIMQMEAHGRAIDPLSIPMILAKVKDVLRIKPWIDAQGAGIVGQQFVTVLDATVPKGKCVLAGFKTGKKVAIWRFPTVLPQGLVTCEVMEPNLHHLVEGHIIPYTIFLNPEDLTARMQGDDDGDIVGVSSDPRIVELFSYRASENIYLIEPKGEKYDVKTNSPEGFKYLETDPRGPVGRSTIWQAEALAGNDWWQAIALAVVNQEFIDAAKRKIAWTDPAKACNPGNWIRNSKGYLEMKNTELPEDKYEYDPNQPIGCPLKYVNEWHAAMMEKCGRPRNKEGMVMVPLAWRKQQGLKTDGAVEKLSKRIDIFNWIPCADKCNGFTGRNLVHECHDIARTVWMSKLEEWQEMFAVKTMEMRDIVPELMELNGIEFVNMYSSWDEYMELRERSGIVKFGKDFRKIMKARDSEEEDDESAKNRLVRIGDINMNFYATMSQLTLQELANIWYWELTATPNPRMEGVNLNNPNYAFRTVQFSNSPLLRMFGIETEEGCDYLVGKENIILNLVKEQEHPFVKLAEVIFKSTKHGDVKKNELGRIEMMQCKHCIEAASTLVMQDYRKSKTNKQMETLRRLVTTLSKAMERPWSSAHLEKDNFDIPCA